MPSARATHEPSPYSRSRPIGGYRYRRTAIVACYFVRPKPPSHEEYKTWVMMGYLGSYERYEASVLENGRGAIHIHGDFGPHCTECAAPGENLCDYPVGDCKTCDRPLCDDHAKGVANDTHYCRDHFIMWREYLASERGYEVLNNVTPLGVVSASGMPPEGTRREGGSGASAPASPVAKPDAQGGSHDQ